MDILSQPDNRGDTPLSVAVTARNLVAVRKLLHKPSVQDSLAQKMCQALDSNQIQPLYKAASQGCAEICRLLIDRGAPTDKNGKTNAYGSTPLDAAFKGWQEWHGDDVSRLQEFEDTVNVLMSKSGKIAGKFRKFVCATWRGSVSVCGHFESIKARRDKHGWLPTVISASFGNQEIAHAMCSDSNKKFVDQLLLGEVPSKPHGYKPSEWSTTAKHKAVTLSEKNMVAVFTSCGKVS